MNQWMLVMVILIGLSLGNATQETTGSAARDRTNLPPQAESVRDNLVIRSRPGSDEPRLNVCLQQDPCRFQQAYALIQKGEYRLALDLLQKNIAETPNAGNIDYAYGWAVVCAAHLGDAQLTLDYYEVIRLRFGGWQHLGANGAHRIWEKNLAIARQAVAASAMCHKHQVLERMHELDRLGRQNAVRDVKALIRRVQQGDQLAIGQLRSPDQTQLLVDLIVENQLRLVPD